MQNSHDCMFCRYRKARIAACCGAGRASPAQLEGADPARSVSAAPSDNRDRTVPPAPRQPSRQDKPQFA
jgi:hypothetical protein